MNRRLELAAALSAALLAVSCDRADPAPDAPDASTGGAPTADGPAAPIVGAPSIPDPETGGMEPRVATRIAEGRARVVAAPGDAAAWGGFGTVLYPHEFFEAAADCFAEAHRLAPTEFKWPYMLAVTLDLRGGDPQRMRELFEEARRLRPDYLPLLLRRAEAMSRAGEIDAAMASLRQVLDEQPRHPGALRRMGELLLLSGKPEEAASTLELAAAVADPPSGGIWRALAQAYQRSGRADDAAKALERSRALDDLPFAIDDPVLDEVMAHGISSSICLDRGERLLREGRAPQAFTLFKVCEEVHPQSAMVQTYLGLCLAAMNQLDSAEANFRRAIELSETQYDALVGLANILIRRKDLDGAAALLDRAIAADDARPQGHARRALLRAEQGRLPEAFADFEAAESRGPLTAADHYNWARALIDARQPAPAEARLQKALAVDPRHVASHYLLASLYESVGVNDRARWHYEMVLKLQPNNTKAAERLAKLPK